MSLNLHIGPYLVIPRRQFESSSTSRGCSAGCANPAVSSMAKFCAHCGAAIVLTKQLGVVTRSPRLTELEDKWTDFMWQPERTSSHSQGDIWLPNYRGHRLEFENDAECNAAVDFSDIDHGAMLRNAVRYYAQFVEAVIDRFGVTPQWHFGIVAYSH